MTIDNVMRGPVVALELASNYYDEAVEDSCRDVDKAKAELRAAILALLDAEAEACHAIVSEEDLRWDAMDRIRARIAARKGGNDD